MSGGGEGGDDVTEQKEVCLFQIHYVVFRFTISILVRLAAKSIAYLKQNSGSDKQIVKPLCCFSRTISFSDRRLLFQSRIRAKAIVHACTIAIATEHACTIAVVYACTLAIVHVSCPTGLII